MTATQAPAACNGHNNTRHHFAHQAAHYDERHARYNRQTLSQAVEALALTDSGRLLDVGCGTGEFIRLALQRFPAAMCIGVDVTRAMLAQAREKFRQAPRVRVALATAEALPFDAERFEAVVSCNMLHHVQEVRVALREWARVLRPGGQLLIVDWCRDAWHCRAAHYWLRLVKRSYVRMYRADELRVWLSSLGLAVDDVRRFFVPPYYSMLRLTATKRT